MMSLASSDYLVLRPNCSNKEILNIAEAAYREGRKTVLFSVPDSKIRRKLLRFVSVAIFDEFQVGEVSKVNIEGLPSLKTAILRLYGRGVETIIVKMGTSGVLIFEDEVFTFIDPLANLNLDVEALGNVFNAILPLTLGMQSSLLNAVKSAYQTAANIALFLNSKIYSNFEL